MGRTENENDLKVLQRGFQIVELISDEPGLTFTEITEKLELPKSTAHIYLQTLENIGYIINTGTGYKVSFEFLNIGGLRRSRFRLYKVSQDPITELASNTDTTLNVGLGTEERGQRIIVDKIEGEMSPFADVPIGHTTNLHWVAQGKALLSKFPQSKINSIIDCYGLPVATENTITSRSNLFEEIESIHNQGYALEDGERIEGIRAIAVPVEGKESDPYGTISISGPKSHLSDNQINEVIDHLRTAKNIIEIEYKNY